MADSKLMQGKRGLVMGVANDHSIAWGIARVLAAHGAEIAFTYQKIEWTWNDGGIMATDDWEAPVG